MVGYKIVNKKFEIDEDTSPIVKKIFDMYNSGNTMAEIIVFLNNHNFKTAQNNKFNKNSIKRILENKKYIGIYYNKFDDVEIKDDVPRIIDDETFEKAQEILKKNKKAPARAKTDIGYLLTTKLFCENCNEMLTGTSGTS